MLSWNGLANTEKLIRSALNYYKKAWILQRFLMAFFFVILFIQLHILLIQTLTAGLYRESSTPLVGRTSFALLCKAIESQKNIGEYLYNVHFSIFPFTSDCCTVDMGIPYSWFDNSTGLIMSSLYSTRVSMSY